MSRLRYLWLILLAHLLDRVLAFIAMIADARARPPDWTDQ